MDAFLSDLTLLLVPELQSLKTAKGILKQTNKQTNNQIADDTGILNAACLVLLVTVNALAIFVCIYNSHQHFLAE